MAARLARCEHDGQLLAAFSYRGVLARGFTLVRDAAGQPLRTAAAVVAGTAMEIEFIDGRVGAQADGRASPVRPFSALPRPRSRRDRDPGQGDLF
jgi:exodeoxyribonuclease VII large subunit